MKTLIFITLKILEIIAILISLTLLVGILFIIDHYTGYIIIISEWLNRGKISVGLICQIITAIYIICLIPNWLKKNKEWTNKIYSTIKNNSKT